MLRRRGRGAFTLAETLVVLALGALVLGVVTSVGARLQHQMTIQAARFKGGEQLAIAGELLPLELRGLSPRAGDVAEATDSTIQYRATIMSAVVCGATASTLIIAPFLGGGGRSVVPSVQAGDTLWMLAADGGPGAGDSAMTWRPNRVTALRRVTSSCPALDSTSASVVDRRSLWAVDVRDSLAVSCALFPVACSRFPTVIRVTRPQRLSLYRASDARWYLGLRTWNAGSAQFNTVQPLSGPYGGVSRFRYFDAAARPIPLGTTAARTIARIEAVLIDDGRVAADSQIVAIAVRNR